MIEGVLIVVAALSIFEHAWSTFRAPRAARARPPIGLGAQRGGDRHQRGLGRPADPHRPALRSPALVADGKHLLADVVTSVGVIVGVGLAVLTG